MFFFRTFPATNDPHPSLMVGGCLELAPDVNFFLNPRKCGFPCCWHNIYFLFLFFLLFFKHTKVTRNEGGRRRLKNSYVSTMRASEGL